MRVPDLLVLTLAVTCASAIDFADWAPQAGLPTEFRPFLEALVTAAEDRTVTTGYTDYFVPDVGMQNTLTKHCTGANEIQKCKEYFLANGRDIVHFPNATFVVDNNATAVLFESQGRIEQTFGEPYNNCSQSYYKTQYTILKTIAGLSEPANLTPAPQGQVYQYNDYFVWPAALVSDIPCYSLTRELEDPEKPQ